MKLHYVLTGRNKTKLVKAKTMLRNEIEKIEVDVKKLCYLP